MIQFTSSHLGLTLLSLTLFQTSPGFYILQYKSFENTVGKAEIACNEQFLLFPMCFQKTCCLQTLSVWKGLKFVIWERVKHLPILTEPAFNPFPWFLRVCSTGLLKTQWENQKLSISPFPLVFSIHIENFLPFSSV